MGNKKVVVPLENVEPRITIDLPKRIIPKEIEKELQKEGIYRPNRAINRIQSPLIVHIREASIDSFNIR